MKITETHTLSPLPSVQSLSLLLSHTHIHTDIHKHTVLINTHTLTHMPFITKVFVPQFSRRQLVRVCNEQCLAEEMQLTL